MEKLVEGGHGVTALLAGLVIILCLHLIAKLAHFVWEFNQKKHDVTEGSIKNLTSVLAANTSAIIKLEERMRVIENHVQEFNKFKVDLRLLIQAIKELAGDKWPDIRRIILDDKFPDIK